MYYIDRPYVQSFFYSILGLKVDCTDEEIRKYFRRQAVLVHPDKVGTVKLYRKFIFALFKLELKL